MNLKDYRLIKKFTQQELAYQTGINQNKISRIENGELEMKVSELGKLQDALKLNANELQDLIENQVKNAKPLRKYNK